MKKLIEIPDKYQRANNIAKTVRSLQRVPEKERPRIVNKAVFNIYVIGSAMVLYDCLPCKTALSSAFSSRIHKLSESRCSLACMRLFSKSHHPCL